MKNVSCVFVEEVVRPKRYGIIKRGVSAKEYFTYCNEVGCDIFGLLKSMDSYDKEPVCVWLNSQLVLKNTSIYVQGIEVESLDNVIIPEGFDVIEIEESLYLKFTGEKFIDTDFEEAINIVHEAMDNYDLVSRGYEYDNKHPRYQFEPIGERGYIELLPVKKIKK